MAQGTVKEYDEQAGTGSVLLEDRREVAIDAGSIGDPAILTLRLGQRVRFDIVEDGGRDLAKDLRLVTFE